MPTDTTVPPAELFQAEEEEEEFAEDDRVAPVGEDEEESDEYDEVRPRSLRAPTRSDDARSFPGR
jgi:hypothetical protein